MTQEEKRILIRALADAKRNGFDINDAVFTDEKIESWLISDQKNYLNILFDHRFAKAFFGKEYVYIDPIDNVVVEGVEDDEEIPEEEERPQMVVDLVETVDEGHHPIAGLVCFDNPMNIPHWQFQLVNLVLSSDPIDYLRRYFEEHDQLISENPEEE